jgi:hypothetical protein
MMDIVLIKKEKIHPCLFWQYEYRDVSQFPFHKSFEFAFMVDYSGTT